MAKGQIIAYPTESFFALAVKATDKKSIQQLFRVKHREPGKPIALIGANTQQVKKFFNMNKREQSLAKQYWPGAVTLVLKPKPAIAARALGATRIGIRVPAHAGARRLAAAIGAPITATSANISGQPPTKSRAKVKRDFPGILVIAGRCGRAKQPSTVVTIMTTKIKVLRQGAVHV